MPNKTIYLRNEDVDVWERSKRIADTMRENVSQVIVRALLDYNSKHGETSDKIDKLVARVKS